jgi:peptide/nickel transport system substrate-binding protein
MRKKRSISLLAVVAVAAFALLLAACSSADDDAAPQTQAAPATAVPSTSGGTTAPATAVPSTSGGTTAPVATTRPVAATARPATPSEDEPRYGGVLTFPMLQGRWSNLDPSQQSGTALLATISHSHLGLLGQDRQDRQTIIGELAESWELTEGGTKYTFHMRPGVLWEDGEPITAEDAVYSLSRIQDKPEGLNIYRTGCIRGPLESITAPDSSTVEVNLTRASNAWMDCFSAGWVIIQKKSILETIDVEERVREMRVDEFVANGPFKLKGTDADNFWELERNENYFRWESEGKPYLDGVLAVFMPDFQARQAAFLAGRLHRGTTFPTPPKSQMDELEARLGDKITVQAFSTPGLGGFWFNSAQPPFDDVKMRRAVHLAMDRWELLELVRDGAGRVSHPLNYEDWVMPYAEWIQLPGIRKDKTEDIAEAKRLVDEYIGGGQGVKGVFGVHATGRDYGDRCLVQVGQLAKAGIEVTCRGLESLGDTLDRGDFNFWNHSFNQSYQDPSAETDWYSYAYTPRGGPFNMSPRMEELHLAQDVELDQAKRAVLLREIIDILLEDLYFTWTYRETYFLPVWNTVRNYSALKNAATSDPMDTVWLAE